MASSLFCLFMLAMLPERVLHGIFANHEDETIHCSIDYTHLHKASANCHADNIVVHVPFTTVDDIIVPSVTLNYFFAQRNQLCFALMNSARQFCLRGPPAATLSC